MRVRTILALAVTCLVTASGLASAGYNYGSLQNYDLVVTQNYHPGGDVEGRALIGGNVSGGNGPIGSRLQTPNFNNTDTFIVGGSVESQVQAQNGNARVSNSASASNILLNGTGSTIVDSGLSGLGAAIQTQLNTVSANLNALASTGTDPTVPSSPGAIIFNAVPVNGVAVFHVSGNLFSSQNVQQISLNANGATSIVINVSGTNDVVDRNFVGADFGNDAIRRTVIFNFYQNTGSLTVSSLQGSLLAPTATLSNSGSINGSVFVQNFNQGGEVHLPSQSISNLSPTTPLYTGIFPTTAVPEPGAWLLMGLGIPACLAYAQYQRRRLAV